MRLSKTQRDVLTKMADGWEMGVSTTMNGHCWLQKGGVGMGGDSINVHTNTKNSLEDKGLIESPEYGFPSRKYRLTDAGRAALEEE